ncbi:MAG TPA: NAD-dependent epimerase/dehydratase family protein, partial [Anaerolineae bacterium]|nr:NAD-dependent epimerase/dehydratase family protein [Anaerolineae bacterium]
HKYGGAMILVTGATGFLGHNLCEQLIGQGDEVRALVRRRKRRDGKYALDFLRNLGVELVWGDVRDAESVARAIQGCEHVIHAAAKFRMWGPYHEFHATNVEGTLNVLHAARQAHVQRFVHVSTVAVVGRPAPGRVIDEDYPCAPHDAYQRTKLEAERLVLSFHAQYGLPVIVVRPGALYGPWGHYALNRLFFEDFLRGWRVQVRHGRHITFPVYVKDAAWGIALALRRGRVGQIYNVSGESISHREANAIVSRLSGKGTWRLNAPAWLMLAFACLLEGVAFFTRREPWYPLNLSTYVFYDWRVSSEKAQRELGFHARPFEEGARETLEWYRAIGLLKG